jgi:hypothetical protein
VVVLADLDLAFGLKARAFLGGILEGGVVWNVVVMGCSFVNCVASPELFGGELGIARLKCFGDRTELVHGAELPPSFLEPGNLPRRLSTFKRTSSRHEGK